MIYGGQLPPGQPAVTPDPFALVPDMTHVAYLATAASWAGSDDGYVGVYGFGELSANLAVLWFTNQGS
ncbi:hypothetical protein ABFA25_09775 [Mycobacterium lepromatosis]|uniref:hypothetical protein n=1 Tax=Mycobacterium lepromatosis TaxID=480418 RepID=UPI003D809124